MSTETSVAQHIGLLSFSSDSLSAGIISRIGIYTLLFTCGFCSFSIATLCSRILANIVGNQFNVFINVAICVGIGVGAKYASLLRPCLWQIQLGITTCGVLFALGGPLVDHALFQSESIIGQTMFGSLIDCVGLLAIPSVLIGCSLPLSADYVTHVHRGRAFANVCSLYILGATAAILLTEFLMVPRFGLIGTMLIAAALNTFFGVVLVKKCVHLRNVGGSNDTDHPRDQTLAVALASIASAVFLFVVCSIAQRVFGPIHETFAVVLASLLIGAAGGVVVGDKVRIPFGVAAAGLAIGIIWFFWAFELVARFFAANYYSSLASYANLVLLEFACTALLVSITAISFGAAASSFLQWQCNSARRFGHLVFISCVAHAVGFLLVAFVLQPVLEYGVILLVVVGLCGVAVIVKHGSQLKVLAGVTAGLLIAAGSHWATWDESLLFAGHSSFHSIEELEEATEHLAVEDVFKDHQNTCAVTTLYDEDYLFIDGRNHGPISPRTELVVAAMSSIFAPQTDRALVLGVGSGVIAGTLGQVFEATTVVAPTPIVLKCLERFEEDNFDVMRNPSVTFVKDDANRFAKIDDKQYSLIINTINAPLDRGNSKLYSEDFFQLIRKRLATGGVYVTRMNERFGDSGIDIVLNTIRQNFDYCAIGSVAQDSFLLFCSDDPIRAHHPNVVAQNVNLTEHLFDVYDLNPEWLAFGLFCTDATELIDQHSGPINTLNNMALKFTLSRQRDEGIDNFVDSLIENMTLDQQRSSVEPVIKWDPVGSLSFVEQMLDGSAILDSWFELVDEEYPEAREELDLAFVAKVAEWAEASGTPQDLLEYGYALMRVEEFELAIEQFKAALEIDEMFDDANCGIGTCYENLEKYDKALEYYGAELKVDPEDEDVPYLIGRTALADGRFDVAEMSLRLAIELYNDSENHQLRAEALEGLDRMDEARREFEIALDLDPENEAAREGLERLDQ